MVPLMKSLRLPILAALLGFLIAALLPFPAPAAEISWVGYARGVRLARESNRKVLIYFRTARCMFCEHMERKTFAAPDVADYINDHYIPIHVDADLERDIASTFRVAGFPTSWFLSATGKPIRALPGFVAPRRYLHVLQYIETDAYQDMTFKAFMDRKGKTEKENNG